MQIPSYQTKRGCVIITFPAEQLHNLAKYWCRDLPNMSGNISEPELVLKAVQIIIKTSHNLTLPQAMRAAGFTMSDSKLPRLQMQVR